LLTAGSQWQCSHGSEENFINAEDLSVQLVVKTVPVSRQEWIETVPLSGSIQTLSTVEVKPEVGGRLISVFFKEGDLVRKGQLLGEIDPVNYRLAYEQAAAALSVAEAGVERARVSAEYAKAEKERADNLLRSGGITQKDHLAAVTSVKDTETQVRLGEAQCIQARAALAIAEKALQDCRIEAPADGHVQNRFFDRGSLLVPGVALFTLVDNSRLELECVIPSYRLASIRLGQKAQFTTPTWGTRLFEGTVSAINPVIEADNRSVKLKVKVANPGGELRSGMYAKGEITVGRESEALVVPRDALIPEEEGGASAGVYVVQEGKARRIDVQVEDTQRDRVWIREGLSGGELVIAEIGPSLKDGAEIRILQ
jgi:membrane fusion protein (multidrug efflux system)